MSEEWKEEVACDGTFLAFIEQNLRENHQIFNR